MTAAATDARARIGAFLAGRGYSCLPDGEDFVGWYSPRPEVGPEVGVFLDGDEVAVQVPGGDGDELLMPADAPDLLEQLAFKLNELGA